MSTDTIENDGGDENVAAPGFAESLASIATIVTSTVAALAHLSEYARALTDDQVAELDGIGVAFHAVRAQLAAADRGVELIGEEIEDRRRGIDRMAAARAAVEGIGDTFGAALRQARDENHN